MSVETAVIVTIGTIVVAAIGYLGAKVTAHQAANATVKAAEVQEEADELRAWRDLAGEYRADRNDLRDRLTKIEERQERQDTALRAEQLKREGMARELDRERERLTSLERRFRAAVAYIQSLLTLLRENDIEPPPAPKDIGVE